MGLVHPRLDSTVVGRGARAAHERRRHTQYGHAYCTRRTAAVTAHAEASTRPAVSVARGCSTCSRLLFEPLTWPRVNGHAGARDGERTRLPSEALRWSSSATRGRRLADIVKAGAWPEQVAWRSSRGVQASDGRRRRSGGVSAPASSCTVHRWRLLRALVDASSGGQVSEQGWRRRTFCSFFELLIPYRIYTKVYGAWLEPGCCSGSGPGRTLALGRRRRTSGAGGALACGGGIETGNSS